MLVIRRLSAFPPDDSGGKQAANRSTRQKNVVRQEPQGDRGFEAQTEEAPDERGYYCSKLSPRQPLRFVVNVFIVRWRPWIGWRTISRFLFPESPKYTALRVPFFSPNV